MLVEFLLISVLIVISGIFTTVELAVLSVNRNKINLKVEEGDEKARLISETIEKSDMFLSTMAISRTTIWLFVGAYAARVFIEPATDLADNIFNDIGSTESLYAIVIFVTIVCLSYIILIFGEVVPKKIAINNPEKIAYLAIKPTIIFLSLCKPFVSIISISAGCILKILGIREDRKQEHVTEEEIRMLVDAGGEIGNIAADEMQMINNVFEFNDKTVEEISTHRTDIVSLNVEASTKEVVAVVANDKYSRIPVYEDNIDNVIGVLHIKDIMKYIANNESENNLDIRSILRKPYFVPTSKKADELFGEMKNNKIQFSIVIDEYGGTVGIVTMEDLIEEIMGNIFDEYDGEEVPEIDELDKNTFIINGTTSLEEVSEYLDTPLPVDEYDTIGGFVIGQLGRIPSSDEQPEIEFEGLTFKVKGVYEKRIQKIIVCKVVQKL